MIIDIEDWYRYYDVVFYGNYQVRVKVRREGLKSCEQTINVENFSDHDKSLEHKHNVSKKVEKMMNK